MAEGTTSTNDAHGREEHTLAMDQPPSSSTKSIGKTIHGAYDEEHDGAASSTKLIPKANADNMTHVDMDHSLNSTPVPKKNQPPQIPSYLSDTRDHSPSRDVDREHNPRASKYGLDNDTPTGESSTTKSIGDVRDGIPSPRAAALAQGTTAASFSMKSVIPVDPKTEEDVNSLAGPSFSTPSLTKAVQDVPSFEERTLVVGRPPSSWTKSLGKAIETYGEEHDGAVSSTKIISKANADAGPSVRAPAPHHEGVVAAIGGLAQVNASNSVASSVAPTIQGVAQHDVNSATVAVGGGGHVPAQINGRGNAVIAARPHPAAIPVAALPPNPRVNNIDPLTNSDIRPRRNHADGDEGKIWDKLT